MRLDESPTQRKVRIAERQADDAMQVIRQLHAGVDVPDKQVVAVPLKQVNSEEISTATVLGASIVKTSSNHAICMHSAQYALLLRPTRAGS